MKVKDSTATQCRWYEEFVKDLEEWDVLFEDCEVNYSGHVYLIARSNINNYVIVNYDYGSCSGCDGYVGMSSSQLEEEREALRLCFTKDELIDFASRYLKENIDKTDGLSESLKSFYIKFLATNISDKGSCDLVKYMIDELEKHKALQSKIWVEISEIRRNIWLMSVNSEQSEKDGYKDVAEELNKNITLENEWINSKYREVHKINGKIEALEDSLRYHFNDE